MAEALATVSRMDGIGMITLRGDMARIGQVAASVLGADVPQQRQICLHKDHHIGWMSPDELLCLLPAARLAGALEAMQTDLTEDHALVVDVSDARVVFDVTGPHADDVVAKLSPADLTRLGDDELRRTRTAQVAAAFWRIEAGFRIISFRSTADYLKTVLENAALPGSQLAPR